MKRLLFIRVDGGKEDGLGHIKRCISLANVVAKNKNFFDPIFIINKNNNISKTILIKNNFLFFEVNGKINTKNELNDLNNILKFDNKKFLIIDSKRVSRRYVTSLKKYAKVITFEDEKKYNTNSDLLINNNIWALNFYKNQKNKLLGLKYNTISNNFFKKNTFDHNSKKILISLGGEDPYNITQKILKIIYPLLPGIKFLIILGHSHPQKKTIRKFCISRNINSDIIDSPEDISFYLNKVRFVISAGGLSAYEFAAAGIPQLITVLDKHQNLMVKKISNAKCGIILSHTNKYSKRIISNKFLNFYNDQNLLKKMNNNGRKMIKKSGCDLIVYNLLKKNL